MWNMLARLLPYSWRPDTGSGKKQEKKMKRTLKTIGMALLMTALFTGSAYCATASSSSSNGKKAPITKKSDAHQAKAHKSHRKALPSTKININKATSEQLQQLPRIGAKVAQRIIDYRNAHKGFKSIDELSNVRGIGAKTLDGLRKYVTL